MRKIAICLLVLIGAGFIAINVLAYNHAYAMTHYTQGGRKTSKPERLSTTQKLKVLVTGITMPRPVTSLKPTDLAPDCRSLSITVSNGVTLSAWYADRGASSPLVVLFHGYDAEKTSLLLEARTFLDVGASVLLVDFRGSGDSSESYTTIGVREADDVAAVAGYARDNLPHSRLVLFGQSMGAVSILRAIHLNGVAPDAVILQAVFDTMLHTVRHRFTAMGVPSFPGAEFLVFWGGRQWNFNGFAHNPVDYAGSLTCPALFMHGTDDPRVTLAEGRRVFAAVRGPKDFKEFTGTGHTSYAETHPEEWRAAVSGFLAALRGPARPR